MDVGTKLKVMREKHHFTQEFVANVLGIGQSTYCALESGKTKLSVDRSIELGKLYDVPASFFYPDSSPNTNYNFGERSRSIFQTEVYNEEKSSIKELYERVIEQKDEQIKLLFTQLQDCKEEKEYFKRVAESKLTQEK